MWENVLINLLKCRDILLILLCIKSKNVSDLKTDIIKSRINVTLIVGVLLYRTYFMTWLKKKKKKKKKKEKKKQLKQINDFMQ